MEAWLAIDWHDMYDKQKIYANFTTNAIPCFLRKVLIVGLLFCGEHYIFLHDIWINSVT